MASKSTDEKPPVNKGIDSTPPPTKARRSGALGAAFKLLGLGTVLGVVASVRIFNEGVFIPWSCSVLGYDCSKRYNVEFRGYVNEDYKSAEDAFKNNFFIGDDVGAAVTVYVDGEIVIDMQGGWQNVEDRIPYTNNTLQMVFSSTKALTSIVVAQMVEKGLLSYDEKIATYWPEFAQGNKENVTVEDLMQHAAGVGFFDKPLSTAEAEDPERFSHILAAQPHNFGGVRTRGYHGTSRGWYVNEILRRVANRTVHDVAMELNEKYDIEWNLKPYQEKYDSRIAPFYPAPKLVNLYRVIKLLGVRGFIDRIFTSEDAIRKMPRGMLDNASLDDHITLRHRRIESPSFSGFTNSRSIAKLAAMMANGGKAIVDGEPDLLNEETYALATGPVPVDFDLFFQLPMPALKGGWGISDGIAIEGVQFVGWAGMGGSVFIWNPEHKIGFGYCMNGMHPTSDRPDRRSMSILRAVVKRVLEKEAATQNVL
ncbi:beta-lactamase/transpeptidase-like protein [Fennellomyces sp. T-0311]|nr:beta-lactamase/transpeptidase-like protein [Fennellomyces sp. T-0311]